MIYAWLSIKYAPVWVPILTGTHIPGSPLTNNPIPIKHGLPAVTIEATSPEASMPNFSGTEWNFDVEPREAGPEYGNAFAWVQVQVKNNLNDVYEIIRLQAAPNTYVELADVHFVNIVTQTFFHVQRWWCIQTSVAGELRFRYILNGMYYTAWLPMPKVNCYNGEYNSNGSPYPPFEAPWVPWPR